MTTRRSQARAIVFTGLGGALPGLAFVGCGLFAPSAQHFLIRVDSIAVPASVAANDTLRPRFYGPIGPDGCWSLDGVDRQTTSASLDVTFHGKHFVPSGSGCTAMPIALAHTELVAPPLNTPFTITVHQPDGSLLRRLVTAQ
jgi:hypothetical protein